MLGWSPHNHGRGGRGRAPTSPRPELSHMRTTRGVFSFIIRTRGGGNPPDKSTRPTCASVNWRHSHLATARAASVEHVTQTLVTGKHSIVYVRCHVVFTRSVLTAECFHIENPLALLHPFQLSSEAEEFACPLKRLRICVPALKHVNTFVVRCTSAVFKSFSFSLQSADLVR